MREGYGEGGGEQTLHSSQTLRARTVVNVNERIAESNRNSTSRSVGTRVVNVLARDFRSPRLIKSPEETPGESAWWEGEGGGTGVAGSRFTSRRKT